MQIKEKTLKKVVSAISMTKNKEIGCMDCYEEIDQFVEMLRSGKDPEKIMPLVQHHIKVCPCCKEELEALISALEVEDN